MTTNPPSRHEQALKICVVGPGAIGATLAYRLATPGRRVSVVARGAHLSAIRHQGLRLVDATRESTLAPKWLAASDSPADLGPQDIVFIALKSYDVGAVLPRLTVLLHDATVVVPVVNGVPWWYFHELRGPCRDWQLKSLDPHQRMFHDLDPRRIVGCVAHIAAQAKAPGLIEHTNGSRFIVGELDGTYSPRLALVANIMADAGFTMDVVNDIRREIWWKLLGNMSFNPLAALHRKLIHEISDDEDLCAIVRPVMLEGMAICAALGVHITGTPDERIAVACHLRGAKISMHQDVEAGRRLELDSITKAPIEIADRLGVLVPALRKLDADITRLAVSLGLHP
ncbi:MAG TPA: 2-dehydropantoate 2-reductase [Burkholderiaceae bacterium]|nr:2-dehydropantoate 2-reductase [Burkholderiaceae bacterium]